MANQHQETWLNDVDPATLQDQQQIAYRAWIDASRTAKKLHDAFIASMQCDAEPGCSVKANHMRGTLNMCFNAKDKPVVSNGKAKISLSDYLAQRKANGQGA